MTMRRIDLQPLEPFTSDFIDRTGAFNPGALEAATAIIEQVRRDGDAARRGRGPPQESARSSRAGFSPARTGPSWARR